MSQVTLLLTDVVQATENKAETSRAANDGTSNKADNDSFSKLVDKHISTSGNDSANRRASGKDSSNQNRNTTPNDTVANKQDPVTQDPNTVTENKQQANAQADDGQQPNEIVAQVAVDDADTDHNEQDKLPQDFMALMFKADAMLTAQANATEGDNHIETIDSKKGSTSQLSNSEQRAIDKLARKLEQYLVHQQTEGKAISLEQMFSEQELAQLVAMQKLMQSLEGKYQIANDVLEGLKGKFFDAEAEFGVLPVEPNELSDESMAAIGKHLANLEAHARNKAELTNQEIAQELKSGNNINATNEQLSDGSAKALLNAMDEELTGILSEEGNSEEKATTKNQRSIALDQAANQFRSAGDTNGNSSQIEELNGAEIASNAKSDAAIQSKGQSQQPAENNNAANSIKVASQTLEHSNKENMSSSDSNEQQDSGKQNADSEKTNNESLKPSHAAKDEAAKLAHSMSNSPNVIPANILGQSSAAEENKAIDSQALQNHLDSIASKVVKDNVETKKVELVQQETIAIYRRDFANAMKDKVMMLVNQKLQQVDIQLDPPELGNVHVRLNLQNDTAAVSFTVQNQQAKEALEQHMFKLKEMLAESGVDVGDANVAQQQKDPESQAQEQGFASRQSFVNEDQNTQVHQVSLANMVKGSATGVDFYA